MASNTINGSTNNQYIDSKIEWSSTPSVATNSSSVTAKLYYKRNNSGYTTEGTGSFSITINGTKKSVSDVQLKITNADWVLAMTATVTVAHNDDGSKSITISATGSLPPSSLTSTNCSGTAKLDTIARASVPTVSASSVEMLGSVTINTNRKSTSFTHDLTYSFGGSTGTIATGVGASYKWTVPVLVADIPNKASDTCTITCKTKSGSAVVGTKTVTLTIKVPASVPTVSSSSVNMGGSVTVNTKAVSKHLTHDLTYSFGTGTGTIATGLQASDAAVAIAKNWTVPVLVVNIPNKASGTCTITCTTKNGTATVGTKTVTLTLTIPASVPTVSSSSVAMKGSVTVTTNRVSQHLTHDLTYSFGGSTGTIATGVAGSKAWTVPDLVSKIPNKSSGACTITCKTKNGTAEVGTKTVTLTLTIPAMSAPTAANTQMGKSVTINTNRKSSVYTHTLSYTIGSKSETIGTGVTTTKAWTPPKSLAAYTGNKTSATCTITCKTYNGTLLVGTDTTTITLTVPDTTVPTLSAATTALGSKITITLPREADVYVHDLTYTLKADGSSTVADSGTIATGQAEEYGWTVPLSLAAKIPSATKGTITVTCKTRFSNSTTEVGTKTVSFAATVPNNSTTQPKVTMTLSPVHSLPSAFNGLYVAGKSKVNVTYSASSDYSTVKTYETNVDNAKGSTNPYTSAVLANASSVNITGKVTDARGYYTTKEKTITVIDYSRPRIIPGEGKNKIICERCNSDGKADPGGVYLLIQIGRKYSKVVSDGIQNNYCKLSYQWKTDAEGEDDYSDPVELLAKTATSDYVNKTLYGIVTSNTTAYNIRLIVEDDVGETDTVTITIPTAFVTFHSPVGGHGFTLGGYHDPAKYNVFDCRFDAEFQGTVSGSVLGLLGCSGAIPENADANDYKVPGVWAVQADAIAKTILNLPPNAKAGLLRVYAATGQKYVTEGAYKYIMHEYRSLYPGTPEYRRRIWTDGAGNWSYGAWVSGIDDVVHLANKATQITGNIYTENDVETCQFMIRAGNDYYVLNLTPSGMVYGKNGKVLWTK